MFAYFFKNIPDIAHLKSDGYDVADFRLGTLLGTIILCLIQVLNHVLPEQIPNITPFIYGQIAIQILTILASYYVTWVKRWANEIGNFFSFTYSCSVLFDAFQDGFPIEESAVVLLIVVGISGMFKFKKMLNLYTFGLILVYVTMVLIKQPTEMSRGFALTVPLIFFALGYYVFYVKLDFLEKLRRNEVELKRNEAWFRNVFDNAPIGIILFSDNLQAFKVNDFFQRLTGYTEGELLGTKVVELIHTDDVVSAPKFKRLIEKGMTLFEQRFWTKDGRLLWLRMEISPMKIDNEHFMIAMLSDFTNEKQTKDQLTVSTEALQRHNEALQEFSYVVSHDLQEPLRMITSFSQIIQRRYISQLDEKANHDFNFVIDGAKRMSTLIRDMLEYSRWTARSLPLSMVSVDTCLKEALLNLTVAIQKHNPKIEFNNLPVLVANHHVLTQLFQNLVSNAMKYRQPNRQPYIKILVEKRDSEWLFSVEDNGIGFEPQFSEMIFGIFQRLHTDRATGNGIGLAISKRIVERQGGRIWAESALGVGSIFFFTLPFHEKSDVEIEEETDKKLPQNFVVN